MRGYSEQCKQQQEAQGKHSKARFMRADGSSTNKLKSYKRGLFVPKDLGFPRASKIKKYVIHISTHRDSSIHHSSFLPAVTWSLVRETT